VAGWRGEVAARCAEPKKDAVHLIVHSIFFLKEKGVKKTQQ
jgi:hypothetical protein